MNRDLLEDYKKYCIVNLKEKLPEFSQQISFHSKMDVPNANTAQKSSSGQPEQLEVEIYIIQTIEIENETFDNF